MRLQFLNAKERKELFAILMNQFAIPDSELKKIPYAFLISEKNKIYAVTDEIRNIDLSRMKVNSAGLYLGEKYPEGIRLSIEGSELFGPMASKNVLEISKEQEKIWMRGEDLEMEHPAAPFLIMKCGTDFLGAGKASRGKILNFIPKVRRISI